MKPNTMMMWAAVAAMAFTMPVAAHHEESEACLEDGYTSSDADHTILINGKTYYAIEGDESSDAILILYEESNGIGKLQRGSFGSDEEGYSQTDTVDDTCHQITPPDTRLLQ